MLKTASGQDILLVAANPKGETRLRLDIEFREIKQALLQAPLRNEFTIETREALRTEDFRRGLLRKPRVVHFCGHGKEKRTFSAVNHLTNTQKDTQERLVAKLPEDRDPKAVEQDDREEGLIFEDQNGNAKLISTEALSELFELCQGYVECVVLNSCFSLKQAEAIGQHIPYVIGMGREIGDQAAIDFSKGFYDALFAGRSTDDAFGFGRNAIRLNEDRDRIAEYGTPVLIKNENIILQNKIRKNAARVASNNPQTQSTIRVFFSYTQEDQELRDKLASHLKIMVREGLIQDWHDWEITAGTDVKGKVSEYLSAADIILLLISSDFLASDYCFENEVRQAMVRHEDGTGRVIPIILRPCEWQNMPFGHLLPLPWNGKSIIQWSNVDEAFLNISTGIRRVIAELRNN